MRASVSSTARQRLKLTLHRLASRTERLRGHMGLLASHSPRLLREQTDSKAAQIGLMQQWRFISQTAPRSLLTFNEAGFRQYSQNDEDGLLLYIFSLIGTTNKRCVEICVGEGAECNTLNLIINHGWWGLLFDGSADNIEMATLYYASNRDTFSVPPLARQSWISAENVDHLIDADGFSGSLDLLSIDIDGNDYWVWKAISAVDPRVVVIEYHNPIPPDLALTVPYDPTFAMSLADDFRGASLLAMVRLGRSKGYRLVGVNRLGFNAFFVKNGLSEDLLPEVSADACAQDPFTRDAQSKRWPKVRDRPWVAV